MLVRLRLFLLLFETAGLPDLPALLRSALTLLAWLAFSQLGLPADRVFGLVVITWFVSGHLLHLRTTLEKIRNRKTANASRVFVVIFAATCALVFLAPGPAWFQHFVTFIIGMHAMACLIDIVDGEETFGRHWWPAKELDGARPMLTRVFLLKHIAFTVLNETLIAGIPVEAWLIWLAMLPIAEHYVNSALVTTVLLDTENTS